MKFTETKLKGAFLIEPDRFFDNRGYLGRTFCREEFAAQGLDPAVAQCNISHNPRRGTLRGMHLQVPPHEQIKLVRCTRGSILDVIIDLREDSPTFKQWVAAELTSENHTMLYIPAAFAHGFQTLEDDVDVFYQMSSPYVPDAGRGVRWNDPAFDIAWPDARPTIAARDAGYPDFDR